MPPLVLVAIDCLDMGYAAISAMDGCSSAPPCKNLAADSVRITRIATFLRCERPLMMFGSFIVATEPEAARRTIRTSSSYFGVKLDGFRSLNCCNYTREARPGRRMFVTKTKALTSSDIAFALRATRTSPSLPSSSSSILRTFKPVAQPIFLTRFSQHRLLSTEVRQAIDKAVASAPVVLFMKGTPETPQCGFSRASVQVLGLQGVDPNKFVAFNVLEDQDLRQGESKLPSQIRGMALDGLGSDDAGTRAHADVAIGIKEYSEWPTIPQLYIDKEFVGGTDILMSMHQDGSLAKLLEEKGVVVKGEEEEASA
ncbi:hypothetical protein MRB53_038608 [Persea americana]|nr:hypothetical protein MRB53_038608 [Persea americana]